MSGKPGIRNLKGMRGRAKGGQAAASVLAAAKDSLRDCAAAFLRHLEARAYSVQSIEAQRWALKGFVEWAESRGLELPLSFTRATLEEFQLHLHRHTSQRGGRPLAINTQIARLGYVRGMFAWMCRSGVLPANPAADLDLPRKQVRQLPKSLTADEIDRMMAIPNPADPFGLRDRTILELFYATGIRRTEMPNLDCGDYDATHGTLLIRQGKGGKSRMVPVGERAAVWLDRFLAEGRHEFDHLPNQTALFLSGYGTRLTSAHLGNWTKGLMRRCGIDKPGSCHLFRHSCATHMHRGGADIRYVQQMLGHERLETTQIYTHVHIEALREVHARTHPHGRLDQDHDAYGRRWNGASTDTQELTSQDSGDALKEHEVSTTVSSLPEVSRHPAGPEGDQAPPFDEDPPAGGACSGSPKLPKTGGPPADSGARAGPSKRQNP